MHASSLWSSWQLLPLSPLREMYIFKAGLCRWSAMALTQGQGFESHCGPPIVKVCALIVP